MLHGETAKPLTPQNLPEIGPDRAHTPVLLATQREDGIGPDFDTPVYASGEMDTQEGKPGIWNRIDEGVDQVGPAQRTSEGGLIRE